MAHWRCKCGNIMNDIVDPNPYGFVVYSERDWENGLELADENNMLHWQDFPDPTFEVYRCPECGRLMVFDDSNRYVSYKPEE